MLPPQWNDITYDDDGNIKTKAMFNYSPWLSNLYPYSKSRTFNEEPLTVYYDDVKFGSSEAAYQFAKAKFFDRRLNDSKYSNFFSLLPQHQQLQEEVDVISRHFPPSINPLTAKKNGGKGNYTKYIALVYGNKAQAARLVNEIMPDWYQESMSIMDNIIASKFNKENNPKFVELLLSTNDSCKIYESKSRGGSIWEKGGTKSRFGALGDMLMTRRSILRMQEEEEEEAQQQQSRGSSSSSSSSTVIDSEENIANNDECDTRKNKRKKSTEVKTNVGDNDTLDFGMKKSRNSNPN
jgi:hypothetical protein